MPGETKPKEASRETIATNEGWRPPAELASRLKPWIDIDEVGPAGLYRWLGSILPLLPRPAYSGRPSNRGELTERICELSRALAAAAGGEARAHFQASEYFRENRVLARRLMALEAMLRTRGTATGHHTAEVDVALDRYLPRKEGP